MAAFAARLATADDEERLRLLWERERADFAASGRDGLSEFVLANAIGPDRFTVVIEEGASLLGFAVATVGSEISELRVSWVPPDARAGDSEGAAGEMVQQLMNAVVRNALERNRPLLISTPKGQSAFNPVRPEAT